jgi:hypothetical protein
MERGASFHLKPVTDPGGSVTHNLRLWTGDHPAPAYLLPAGEGGGYWEPIEGDVVAVHAAKMALASRQARQVAGYSPVWEGVLNLPPPGYGGRKHLSDMVRAFCQGYEAITGHRVVAASIHADEGHVDEGGQAIINSHAHIAVDRTDANGRAIRLTKDQLRRVQDLAAAATGLERGQDARETRIKHLSHQGYRALARAGRLSTGVEIAAERRRRLDEVELAERYGYLRGLMKASGQATQADYEEARECRDDAWWLQDQIKEWERRFARRSQEAEKGPSRPATPPPVVTPPKMEKEAPAVKKPRSRGWDR